MNSKQKTYLFVLVISIFTISLILFSCKNNNLVSPPSVLYHFNLKAADYSTNNYFIDTLYASTEKRLNLFNKYYGNLIPEILPSYRIKKIEVWKSTYSLAYDPSREIRANAYMNLPSISATQSYSNSLRSTMYNPTPGLSENGRFELLKPGTDYVLHPETGYLTFYTQIQDQDAIAVAYQIENSNPDTTDDLYYGEFLNKNSAQLDTVRNLILKLIKPAYLKPQYKEAWKLMLRNIYNVGYTNIRMENFYLNIKYIDNGNNQLYGINGKSFLEILGLDKIDKSGNPQPDGFFDFRPGITINPATGDIIFPNLQPFGRNLPSWVPDSLRYNGLYDTSYSGAVSYYSNKNKFVITSEY